MLVSGRLRFALALALVAAAWGYRSQRGGPRAPLVALIRGLESFVAAGGAAIVLEAVRRRLEAEDSTLEAERVTHIRRTVGGGTLDGERDE